MDKMLPEHIFKTSQKMKFLNNHVLQNFDSKKPLIYNMQSTCLPSSCFI